MATFIDPADAVLLLVDHQTGLFQTVKDIELPLLRANVIGLAKAAQLLSVPVITTASVPEGPNGPLMTEVATLQGATFVPRNGEVNAWDAPAFAETVKATGRKTLLIAGVWTSVCVAFPALAAAAEGYRVYAIIDASGDVSPIAAQVATTRLAAAGIQVTTSNAVVAEMQKTWNREHAERFGEIYAATTPNYAAVMESFSATRQS
ncbi:isochorismatase family protein [uncultured Pseudomonas sp.]|uniref:isochorismatase family protein n=1 Tax=uncultured Pseudomonas sp. TaxID=114707 RepID=UPI0025FED897|nr:isochorismatase family protein [uncultured Pseudomonas sp.]